MYRTSGYYYRSILISQAHLLADVIECIYAGAHDDAAKAARQLAHHCQRYQHSFPFSSKASVFTF